ncbi:hypothetical protein ADIS_4301 [Lunatimonas lonarensis]|uniref:Uncharacterized protein n=1 Tax=Lunatimonas lonarensis TaxID=1232681 RepID=R7ZM11_9BACT|nr:hypothetical protein ADIS_4301 [Lunatimonas lonarensis]
MGTLFGCRLGTAAYHPQSKKKGLPLRTVPFEFLRFRY